MATISAPPGVAPRIVTPWMEERGYTIETPMEVMQAGDEVPEYATGYKRDVSPSTGQVKAPFLPMPMPMPDLWWEEGLPMPGEGPVDLERLPVYEASLAGLIPPALAAAGLIGGWLAGDVAEDVVMPAAIAGTRAVAGTTPIVNGVPISGPGVPEPPRHMVAKEWHVKFQSEKYGTFQMFYWRLTDGRCMSYHSPTKTWKIWRPKKHIVISRDPRVSTLRKLGRLNKRVEKMLRPFQPKGKGFPAKALARTYLSTAEKKLLSAGG